MPTNKKREREETVVVTLRLPGEMKEKLEERATLNFRSFNKEVIMLLSQSLGGDKD